MRAGRGTATLLAAWMATLLAGAVLLGGCAGTDRSSREAVSAEPAGAPAGAPDGGPGGTQGEARGDAQGSAAADRGPQAVQGPDTGKAPGPQAGSALARVAPQARQLVRKADMSVQVDDVAAAQGRAEQLVRAAGGEVYGSTAGRDRDGTSMTVRLTAKVPPEKFPGVLDSFRGLGTQITSSTSTEDVTDAVVDVEARMRSQQESVDRVRALLARARTLGEVVQVESELTRRIADLEALESRQKALITQVDLSTVTLNLSSSGAKAATGEAGGFLGGLRDGWQALATAVNLLLTAVGALLPFLLVGAVGWLPLRWAVRQLRQLRRPPVTPAAAPTVAGTPGE